MLRAADLILYIRDTVSDADAVAVTPAEVARAAAGAIRDYARLAPDLAELPLVTTAAVTDYPLPDGTLVARAVADAAGAARAFLVFGQTLRLAVAPGGETLTLTVARLHAPDVNGDYPTIPSTHLDYAGDLGAGTLLARIADDIARRSDVRDGSTAETWPHNARVLSRRSAYLRARVADALGDTDPYVG